jgi:Raf kinase inhibitor-like YbhB/YbcL family protein
VLVILGTAIGCGSDEKSPAGGTAATGGQPSDGSPGSTDALAITSNAFHDGQTIDQSYRCQAPSPDLSWSGGPIDAKSYAVVFKDVTPGVSNGFLHWVLFDVPSAVHSLPEGVPVGYAPATPAGAHQAPIWNGTKGFNGPCGGNNTYELTLHAMDVATLPGIDETSTGTAAVSAIEAHATEDARITVLSQP